MRNHRRLTALIFDVGLQLRPKAEVEVERNDIGLGKIRSVHLKSMKKSDLRAMSCNKSLLV